MRLPFGLGEKNGEELLAIFDIESGSVGAALVLVHPEHEPTVLYTTRKSFTYMDELDFERFEQAMRATLLDTALALQQEGIPRIAEIGAPTRIKDVYCVFSSPWYMANTRLVRRERQRTDTLRQSDIEELVANCAAEFKESDAVADGENMDGGPAVIEKNAIAIKLNGYPVTAVAGKQARRVDVAVFVSLVGADVLKHVREVVAQVFHHNRPNLHSNGLVLFSTVRDLYPTLERFLIVDVGAEITEVMLVRDNAPLENASFPYGLHTAARDLAAGGSISLSEGLSQLRVGIEHGGPRMERVRERWRDQFAETLAELGTETAVPRTIVLSAPDRYLPWFRDIVTTERFAPLTFTDETFTVMPLSRTSVQAHIAVAGDAEPDTPLSLATLFFNKIRHG